ncbi:drug/metabolite transporter (DMT)-like permease [Inquilinus ginsengisoli]|uniref:DMT family transporter n=1 Tax=Inquilinus ginsengisoli TaxID=363840 RepID=UPI003D24B944
MSASNTPLRWFALPIVTVTIWSGNVVVTKLAATEVYPSVIAFERWALALLLLTPFLIRPVWRLRRQILPHLPKLAVLGLLGMAAYQGLAYFAAETTSATKMGFVVSLVPLLTMALSSLLLAEAPTPGMVGGGGLSLFGMALLLGQGDPLAPFSGGLVPGDGMMLIACVAYSGYSVLLRRWPMPLPAWPSLYLQIAFAALFLLPGWLLAPSAPHSMTAIGMILYAGIPTSILAPFLWMQAIRLLGPSRTSLFINLSPVLTAAIAVAVLGESLHPYHLAGGALVLLGVVLAQRFGRRRTAMPVAVK